MMLKFLLVAASIAVVFAEEKKATVCVSDPTRGTNVTGTIVFTKTDDGIKITGEVTGLSPGKHGFHIHQLGNISPDCTKSGPHFNPHKQPHGGPSDQKRHVGDLGNIVADDTGVAKVDFLDKIIDLDGEHDILGRALVVHADEDDLGKGGQEDSLTTGHAGARVACGVIGKLTDTSGSQTIFGLFPLVMLPLLMLRMAH